MKTYIKLLFLSLTLFATGCQNYESTLYLEEESKVICDIIPELVTLYSIDSTAPRGILYVVNKQDTIIYKREKPRSISFNVESVESFEKNFAEERKRYDKEFEEYEFEKDVFKPILNGKLQPRIFENCNCPDIAISLIDIDKIKDSFAKNEIGTLHLSRIVFNFNLDKGYLNYTFFCGEGCAWGGNVEIVKKNGTWIFVRELSGWIA